MTDKSGTYVGIDLSGPRARCLVGLRNGSDLRYLASGAPPPNRWTDTKRCTTQMSVEAIRQAVRSAEERAGLTIHAAVVGIGGRNVGNRLVHTAVPVPGNPGKVGEPEVRLAVRQAEAGIRGERQSVLQLLPLGFSLDGGSLIRNPLGQTARRLEAYVRVVSVPLDEHEAAKKAVQDSSIQVLDTVLSGYAAAHASFTDADAEYGVAHIELGKSASTMTAYVQGQLRLAVGLAAGSDDIAADVASSLQTERNVAESLIRQYGRVDTEHVGNGFVVVPGGRGDDSSDVGRPWPMLILARAITRRLDDIFQFARIELHTKGLLQGQLHCLRLSGDLAELSGIKELAQSIVGLRTSIGVPDQPIGLPPALQKPGWACAAGLALHAHRLGGSVTSDHEERFHTTTTHPQEKAA